MAELCVACGGQTLPSCMPLRSTIHSSQFKRHSITGLPRLHNGNIILQGDKDMSKMTDRKCQDCTYYDTCEREDSTGCDNYEYYKCKDCVDRVTETGDTPRCFRGGKPCSQVRFCQIGGN